MQVGFLVLSLIVATTFGSIEVIQPSSSDASDETNLPVIHQSHSREEALVWKSSTDCQHVVKDGGRMVVPDPDVLRVGTWNIRWFPHGSPPDRPDHSIAPTDPGMAGMRPHVDTNGYPGRSGEPDNRRGQNRMGRDFDGARTTHGADMAMVRSRMRKA